MALEPGTLAGSGQTDGQHDYTFGSAGGDRGCGRRGLNRRFCRRGFPCLRRRNQGWLQGCLWARRGGTTASSTPATATAPLGTPFTGPVLASVLGRLRGLRFSNLLGRRLNLRLRLRLPFGSRRLGTLVIDRLQRRWSRFSRRFLFLSLLAALQALAHPFAHARLVTHPCAPGQREGIPRTTPHRKNRIYL